MPYLTSSILDNTLDIPLSMPATEIRMGDWLVMATVKLVAPYKLTYDYVTLSLLNSSVDESLIANSNRISGNLGLVYLALRKDYTGGSPGASGAKDIFGLSASGSYQRPGEPLVLTEEGTYSWIVANNMQASSSSTIPAATSIDFRIAVTGIVRQELS